MNGDGASALSTLRMSVSIPMDIAVARKEEL
jgi:hypothetical protein